MESSICGDKGEKKENNIASISQDMTVIFLPWSWLCFGGVRLGWESCADVDLLRVYLIRLYHQKAIYIPLHRYKNYYFKCKWSCGGHVRLPPNRPATNGVEKTGFFLAFYTFSIPPWMALERRWKSGSLKGKPCIADLISDCVIATKLESYVNSSNFLVRPTPLMNWCNCEFLALTRARSFWCELQR